MPDPELDDVDALFARIGMVNPPDDLLQRVMLLAKADGAVHTRPLQRAPIWWGVAYLLALAGLVVLAYGLGIAFATNGTSALLSALAGNATLLSDAPSAYLEALLSSLPLIHIAAVLFDLVLLGTITWLALRLSASGRSGWRTTLPA